MAADRGIGASSIDAHRASTRAMHESARDIDEYLNQIGDDLARQIDAARRRAG